MRIEIIDGENRLDEIETLFREYSKMAGAERCFVTFEKEIANLPGDYAKPAGRLLLALCDGEVAGCIAFRKMNVEECELKRLYVRDAYRKNGCGKLLFAEILKEANLANYTYAQLTTLPIMEVAIKMYQGFGFDKIIQTDGSICMRKKL